MPNEPSPVRAGVQAQTAREVAEQLLGKEPVAGSSEAQKLLWQVAIVGFTERIAAYGAAAEARGRQQAEQARDEALAKLVAHADAYCGEGWGDPLTFDLRVSHLVAAINHLGGMKRDYIDFAQRVAALTQALKDYGQHFSSCTVFWEGPSKCDCGFEAVLGGA